MGISLRRATRGMAGAQRLQVASIIASVGLCAHLAHAQETGWRWSNAKINGMGFVTGIVAHPTSHDIYAKTDVGGIYRFDRANQRWVPMMDAVPLFESPSLDIESIALDAQNPARVAILTQRNTGINTPGGGNYMMGDVMISQDGGQTWQSQGLLPFNIA
jgi:xyloglucan-specific exo-beta-1,4-glucanase